MVEQHVTVSGRNMEIGESLTKHVMAQMATLSEKYFSHLVTSRIVFTKMPKGHAYICNIQVTVGRDMHYASEAQFDGVHRCFKRSYERLAKQLRRKKREKHEDKPNGHQKEIVLNDLLKPDDDC